MIINESFLNMSIIETGDSKFGPYKAIKSTDFYKLNDLKNEIYQQLDNNITTEFKKDVLYIYFKKPVDQSKLNKLFVKYHVN